MVFMLHTVNCMAEMFLTENDGHRSDLKRPSTKIDLGELQELVGLGFEDDQYQCGAVTAFYDPKDRRYAIVWSTHSDETEECTDAPPVFVAVSQSRNPLGDWTVWALNLRPTLAKGYEFCHNSPNAQYKFEFPQVGCPVQCSTGRHGTVWSVTAASAHLETPKCIARSCHSLDGALQSQACPQGAAARYVEQPSTLTTTIRIAFEGTSSEAIARMRSPDVAHLGGNRTRLTCQRDRPCYASCFD